MRFPILVAFCVVIACLFSSLAVPAAAGWTEVPVLVNVQPGVTPVPTDAEIAEMIAETNKLLKQAQIKLMFDKAKSIKRNFATPGYTAGGGGGDNKIDAKEDEKLDPAGVTELEKHTGEKNEGVKIVISNEIHGDPNTLGLAMHDPKSPVIYVKWPQTPVKGGNTTAHEFGHVFTLGKNHVVDDSNNVKADGDGHTSGTGGDNLMHATANGTKLTEDQIEELQKGVKGHGHAVTWLDRAWRWTKKQFDSQIAAPTILSSGLVFGSDMPDPLALSMHTSFGGGLAGGESVSIAMGLDTDNNPLTGRSLERPDGSFMEGVDRTLLINVTGDPDAGGAVTASLLDKDGVQIKLMDVEFEHILKMADNEAPAADETYRAYDQVRVDFDETDMADLGETVVDFPVGFISYDGSGNPADASDPLDPLIIDLKTPIEPGPRVVLGAAEAEAGDFVTIDGLAFFPDATDILIQFDDDEVMRIPNANPQGLFNGIFQVPIDAENGMYFITASTLNPADLDQIQYGFAMLEVTPEPGTLVLLSLGSAAVLRKRRARRES